MAGQAHRLVPYARMTPKLAARHKFEQVRSQHAENVRFIRTFFAAGWVSPSAVAGAAALGFLALGAAGLRAFLGAFFSSGDSL